MGNEELEMRNEKWDDAPLLAESDVREVVRLLGQAAAQTGGHTEIKRRLMRGLCELIEVDAWVWVMTAKMVPGELPVYVGYQQGGFSDEEMSKFIQVQSHLEMARLTESFARELQGSNGTRHPLASANHSRRGLRVVTRLSPVERLWIPPPQPEFAAPRWWRLRGLRVVSTGGAPLVDGSRVANRAHRRKRSALALRHGVAGRSGGGGAPPGSPVLGRPRDASPRL